MEISHLFYFFITLGPFVFQQIDAEAVCYFHYVRDTIHENIKYRSDWSVVTRECFGTLFRFRELDVKSNSKTNKNEKWFESKSFNGLHGVETFLDLILARGQGLYDWRTSPSEEFLERQRKHSIFQKRDKQPKEREKQKLEFQQNGKEHPHQQHLALEEVTTFDLDEFLDNNFVCEKHINELVNKWADSQTHFRTLAENNIQFVYCPFPITVEGMGEAPVDPHRRVIRKSQAHLLQKKEAKYVLENYHLHMHIGMPICEWHLNVIKAGMDEQEPSNKLKNEDNHIKPSGEGSGTLIPGFLGL